jgi:hypothetical protein
MQDARFLGVGIGIAIGIELLRTDPDSDSDTDTDNAVQAALSGSQPKAPGFARGCLLTPDGHRSPFAYEPCRPGYLC